MDNERLTAAVLRGSVNENAARHQYIPLKPVMETPDATTWDLIERIEALEADRASTLMAAIRELTDGDRDIRQETATAIARFVTTYAAETQSDAGQSVKVVGLEQILQVCRKHGATL